MFAFDAEPGKAMDGHTYFTTHHEISAKSYDSPLGSNSWLVSPLCVHIATVYSKTFEGENFRGTKLDLLFAGKLSWILAFHI